MRTHMKLGTLLCLITTCFMASSAASANSKPLDQKFIDRMVKHHNKNAKDVDQISCKLEAASLEADEAAQKTVCKWIAGPHADETISDKQVDDIRFAYEKRRKQLVCKREKQTGTRLSKKVCRTVAQIEEEAQESQDMVNQIQSRSKQFNPDGN